ncbi:MAG: uroporphyrinogen-III C-methyltransferase [Magnetospiraceae bacterium]
MNPSSSGSLPPFAPGSVWLIGAGPGDPGLLTLHAAQGMAQADVVIHDTHVSEDILYLAPLSAETILMGKQGGRPSATQAEINALLIEKARTGSRVVRLKAGDPFVFGRGPAEVAALAEAKIPFRIIPGISAGVGGLAYAGIPLTMGGVNTGVALVSGHGIDGHLPEDVDWQALAKAVPVIVAYMPMARLAQIVAALRAGGRPETEPVAFVANATMETQKVLTTTLGTCIADVESSDLRPPALMVIGPVVDLREKLSWWTGAGMI